MAGTPTAALVTIGLPRDFQPETVEAIYAGLNALARRHQVAIVGGETTTNPERIFISIALLGWVPRGKGVLRSGAEAGDAIFVTGELGGSLAGKHLDFEPRLAEARWLAQHFSAARHAGRQRRAGGRSAAYPDGQPRGRGTAGHVRSPSAAKRAWPPRPGLPPSRALLAALTDGEDFELLFTVASRDAVPLLDAWRKEFPKLPLTCIGKIKAGEGITIRDKHGVRPLTAHGYDHFA